ncbi:MAG: hypothetical protein IT162_03320 [Bryobacterales bacterium]|nr:hypothetical protein [Bryobacterales bacterium]
MVRQILEGEGEVQAVIETVSLGGAGGGFDGADLFIHERGFDEPEALLTPAGDGHFLDEDGLAGVRRVVGGGKCGVERGEAFLIFVAEADAGGEAGRGGEAVGDGVGGGTGFALGRDRAAGFLGVGALGREAAGGLTFVSGHGRPSRARVLQSGLKRGTCGKLEVVDKRGKISLIFLATHKFNGPRLGYAPAQGGMKQARVGGGSRRRCFSWRRGLGLAESGFDGTASENSDIS